MSKITIPSALKKAGFDTVEKVKAASIDELVEVKGVGAKMVGDLLAKIKGKPEAVKVPVPQLSKEEQKKFSGCVSTRALVLKWYDGDTPMKCGVTIGQPLPDNVPDWLIDELLGKGQIRRGLMSTKQIADTLGVEVAKEK